MLQLDVVAFDGFTLDPSARQLRFRGAVRHLRTKPLAILTYLAQHPDRLVTQRELLHAVWPGVRVSPVVLRVCIREIRAALAGETAARLVTIAGRGYRFSTNDKHGSDTDNTFVGRQSEIAHLHEAWIRARGGSRQVVFVSGVAGAGKSALLNRFIDEARATDHARIGMGQCLELHSGLEPYAPLLDLLTRLCGDDGSVGQTLGRWAPSWLQHMPGGIEPAAIERARQRGATASSARMLRELSQAIEQLGSETPLVFVLEDIHWSDVSTLDAIAHLTQRSVATKLLIIASYRRNNSQQQDDRIVPLIQQLCGRGLATEIHLGSLDGRDVEAYLQRRLPGHLVGSAIVETISRYSGANPLFMVTMVDHLLNLGRLTPRDGAWHLDGSLDGVIPDAVGQLVASTMEGIDSITRRVLEGASVVGTSFSAAPVAAATSMSIATVETVCAQLVRAGRLLGTGIDIWPDGTVAGRYDFAHAVYADALYGQLLPAERARMHRAVAEAVDAGYKGRGAIVASLLARHFTLAGNPRRAVHFHTQAAIAAKERFAAREATIHLHSALDLLQGLPETLDRMGTELGCLLELAATSATLNGFANPEVGETYVRAAARARVLNLLPAQIVAVGGLYSHHLLRAELAMAQRDAEQLAALAERVPAPFFTFLTDACLGSVFFSRGTLAAARRHLEQGDAAWDVGFPVLPVDVAVICRCMLALTLLVLGDGVAATAALQRALDRAADMGEHPFSVAEAHTMAAQFHAMRGAREPARQHAEQSLALAIEHGIASHRATATVMRGWADRDVDLVREGLALRNQIGQHLARTQLDGLLAETLLDNGDPDAALSTLDEALAFAAASGEAVQIPELQRLRGECFLRRAGAERLSQARGQAAKNAASAFRSALAIARQQQARLWQARAQASLDA